SAVESNAAYHRTATGRSATAAARLVRAGGQDRLIVTGLDKVDERASLVEFRGLVDALLPRVDLPELLLAVNAWTGFASQFTHLSEGTARVEICRLASVRCCW